MPYEFTSRRTVAFSDTDMAGIVHFAHFFRYMEEAEHAFFRSVGLSIHTQIDGKTYTFPRVHAECDYHAPLRFEDVVEVRVTVREVREKAILFDFTCSKVTPAGAQPCARGSITTVCVTREGQGMKSAPIPPVVRENIHAAPPELISQHLTHRNRGH